MKTLWRQRWGLSAPYTILPSLITVFRIAYNSEINSSEDLFCTYLIFIRNSTLDGISCLHRLLSIGWLISIQPYTICSRCDCLNNERYGQITSDEQMTKRSWPCAEVNANKQNCLNHRYLYGCLRSEPWSIRIVPILHPYYLRHF